MSGDRLPLSWAKPWRRTSGLEATNSVPLTADYEYRFIYPIYPTVGFGASDVGTLL